MWLERAHKVNESLNYVNTTVCMLHSVLQPLGCNQHTYTLQKPMLMSISGKCMMVSHCRSKKAKIIETEILNMR